MRSSTPCTRAASRSSSDKLRMRLALGRGRRGATGVPISREGALRAPTSAYSFVENSFAARVVAHVAQNPELRAELNKRVPPVIVEALQSAVRRTPVRKSIDAALGVLDKVRPKSWNRHVLGQIVLSRPDPYYAPDACR